MNGTKTVLWGTAMATNREWMAFFRAVLPSWKFFDRPGPTYELWVRHRADGGEYGPWRRAEDPVRRRWNHVVFNPEGNLQMALRSLLENLVHDLAADIQASELHDHVAYRLVENWARWRAGVKDGWIQFRVTATEPESQDIEEILVSAEVESRE